jgi:TonB-dependent starch-binding outer membrane protein SusC
MMKRKPKQRIGSALNRIGGKPGIHLPIPWLAAGMACLLMIPSLGFGAKKKQAVPRTVAGMVVDGSNNPISGAVVEMTDVQTGKKIAMFTQQNGHYSFSGLDANHDYKLQATFKGISSDVRTASSFDTRNRIVLNFQIPPPKEE